MKAALNNYQAVLKFDMILNDSRTFPKSHPIRRFHTHETNASAIILTF
jgi:hypothetical protein